MNQYISDKIKVISFFLIIIVMYEHCGFRNDANGIEGMVINQKIQTFFITILGRFAVPLFYMISGYLFFNKTEDGLSQVLKKIRKRARTLLIPYFIAAIVFTVVLYAVFKTPFTQNFVNDNPIENIIGKDIFSIAFSVFLFDEGRYPFPFHLWFLRNLIFHCWYYTHYLYHKEKEFRSFPCRRTIHTVLPDRLFFSLFTVLVCFWFGNFNVYRIQK